MMENSKSTAGFSSPRSDNFPAGLRVLVVDDDPTWLKILEKMLKKCSYEVMTCCLAREALNLLRERKDGFDIVISDVNMPDMNGFKLLEHVGLEMDLPVIMMSVDGETSRVMKGVQHGACDYLLKPIRMKELRNIWQHVLRKRMHEARDIGNHEMDQFDQVWMLNGLSGNKRKDYEKEIIDSTCADSSSMKRARVVWTVDLHQKFVKAVNQIGFDKAGPKKILDLMGVPWLTRENVASHLQKYRLYLTRLQKENEVKASFCGMKHPNVSSKENSLQNPVDVCADVTNDKCNGVSGDKPIVQNESKVKGVVAEPRSVVGDNCDSHTPYCFKGEAPQPQYRQDFKPSENGPSHQPHFHEMRDTVSGKENKPSFFKSRSGVGKLSALEAIQPVSHQIWSMTSQNVDQNLVNGSVVGEDASIQGECFPGLGNIQQFDYSDPQTISGVPTCLYDTLRFDYEYPNDSLEGIVLDQGLFIV